MKAVPGVLGAYHLVDPATGNGLSVGFFEDDADGAEVKAAIAAKAWRSDGTTCLVPPPVSETIYRVIRNG